MRTPKPGNGEHAKRRPKPGEPGRYLGAAANPDNLRPPKKPLAERGDAQRTVIDSESAKTGERRRQILDARITAAKEVLASGSRHLLREGTPFDQAAYHLQTTPDGREQHIVFDAAQGRQLETVTTLTTARLSNLLRRSERQPGAQADRRGQIERFREDALYEIAEAVNQTVPDNPEAQSAAFEAGDRINAALLVNKGADWAARNAIAGWTIEQMTVSDEAWVDGEVGMVWATTDEGPHPFTVYSSGGDSFVYDAKYGIAEWTSKMDRQASGYYAHHIGEANSRTQG